MSVKLERILVLDDDETVRTALKDFLDREGYQTVALGTITEARKALDNQNFDLVLADLLLSGGDMSLKFLGELKKERPKLPIIIFSGHGSMDTAIEAIKLGVFDYLLKPVNADELRIALTRLESIEQIRAENTYLRQELAKGTFRVSKIWGESPQIQEVLRLMDAAAPTTTTVLLQGESGVGKETVARTIVEKSPRADKPFIRVNCTSGPEKNLEAEIFGEEPDHGKGQDDRRPGALEMADGGTLFFEDISELPSGLQAKLVRVLQDRHFIRVEGTKPVLLDLRIIAGSNRVLKEEVNKERFREDLYYLLNVFPIDIPPLRDRGEDVIIIANSLIEQLMRKHGKRISGITADARAKMHDYSWPGNMRELLNVVERAVILVAPGAALSPEDLALQGVPRNNLNLLGAGALPTIDQMEKRLIGLMLKQTANNKSKAAKKLGISIRTMRNKLLKYKAEGIDVEDPENLLRN